MQKTSTWRHLRFISFSSSISSVSGTLTFLGLAAALTFAFAFTFASPSERLLDDSLAGTSVMASVAGASKIKHETVETT